MNVFFMHHSQKRHRYRVYSQISHSQMTSTAHPSHQDSDGSVDSNSVVELFMYCFLGCWLVGLTVIPPQVDCFICWEVWERTFYFYFKKIRKFFVSKRFFSVFISFKVVGMVIIIHNFHVSQLYTYTAQTRQYYIAFHHLFHTKYNSVN